MRKEWGEKIKENETEESAGSTFFTSFRLDNMLNIVVNKGGSDDRGVAVIHADLKNIITKRRKRKMGGNKGTLIFPITIT